MTPAIASYIRTMWLAGYSCRDTMKPLVVHNPKTRLDCEALYIELELRLMNWRIHASIDGCSLDHSAAHLVGREL